MGNIIGNPFDDYVRDQVNTRQKATGKYSNITSDDVKYYNTKLPWMRLCSSVNLYNKENEVMPKGEDKEIPGNILSKLVSLGWPEEELKGEALARNMVLEGVPVNFSGSGDGATTFGSSGLNYENSIFNGDYGYGGTDERGYVPKPGLLNATVQYYNNGANSKTIIKIKAWNKRQLQMIDVLYLRPGYTLLLEFGWSVYLKNGTEGNGYSDYSLGGSSEGTMTKPFLFVMDQAEEDNNNQFTILKQIDEERRKRHGNYDAIFGKVSKFAWNMATDGSYDITCTIIGMGSILESLKVNISRPVPEGEDKGFWTKMVEEVKDNNPYPLIANRDRTFLNNILYRCMLNAKSALGDNLCKKTDLKLMGASAFFDWTTSIFAGGPQSEEMSAFIAGQKNMMLNQASVNVKDVNIKDGLFAINKVMDDNSQENEDGTINRGQSYYIKFGAFLNIIQSRLNISNKESAEKATPYIVFEFNYEDLANDNNYMFTVPGQFSGNPNICVTPMVGLNCQSDIIDDEVQLPASAITEEINDTGWIDDENVYLNRLANVYVNLNYIAQTLGTAPMDNQGAISLLSLLEGVLSGINIALGGVNNFRVMYDDKTGVCKIYDEVPQKFDTGDVGCDLPVKKFTRLNVFGVKPNAEGSFVRTVSLNAELNDQFAALIAIGASVNGAQLTANSTGFSYYNAGLKDRVLGSPTDTFTSETGDENTKTPETLLKENYQAMHDTKDSADGNYPNSYLWAVYGNHNFTESITGTLQGYINQHVKLIQEIVAQNMEEIHSPFFIPFNMSIDMDGLGGIKLFQKFLMTEEVLPPSYERGHVDILAKAVNHDISPGAWTTKLETISMPRNPNLKNSSAPNPLKGNLGKPKIKGPKGPYAIKYFNADMPEDPKLRLRLTRLVDDGKQTLGCFDILAEDETTIMYSLATVELPWLNNLQKKSCIPCPGPGIKWAVTSRANSKYGKHFFPKGYIQTDKGWRTPGSNHTDRTYCLIHRSPVAPGWLMGCIGPGFYFNTKQTYSNGNPKGMGSHYRDPAAAESFDALQKMVGTLHGLGGFWMEMVCLNPKDGGTGGQGKVFQPTATKFSDSAVQSFISGRNILPPN